MEWIKYSWSRIFQKGDKFYHTLQGCIVQSVEYHCIYTQCFLIFCWIKLDYKRLGYKSPSRYFKLYLGVHELKLFTYQFNFSSMAAEKVIECIKPTGAVWYEMQFTRSTFRSHNAVAALHKTHCASSIFRFYNSEAAFYTGRGLEGEVDSLGYRW